MVKMGKYQNIWPRRANERQVGSINQILLQKNKESVIIKEVGIYSQENKDYTLFS